MTHHITVNEVRSAGELVLSQLPSYWKELLTPHLPRVCQELSWIFVEGGTAIDIGGGTGFHTAILTQLGMKAICVDNFKTRGKGTASDYFYDHDLEMEQIAQRMGVQFIHTDILNWKPPFEENSIDVVMSFDNIEHLHHSPRNTYKQLVRCLKPNGFFLLGGPNAANLFKRIRVLLGKNIFSKLEEWYMHEQFIAHVREPIVSDLIYIAEDIDLKIIKVFGRNWIGLKKFRGRKRVLVQLLGKSLELFPGLCSDIYILATKEK